MSEHTSSSPHEYPQPMQADAEARNASPTSNRDAITAASHQGTSATNNVPTEDIASMQLNDDSRPTTQADFTSPSANTLKRVPPELLAHSDSVPSGSRQIERASPNQTLHPLPIPPSEPDPLLANSPLGASQSSRALEEEREEEWILKTISWPPLPPPPSSADNQIETRGPSTRIVCQNKNGPCSLIALANILILRGDINILPPSRRTVTYTYLSSLIADFLVRAPPPKGSDPLSLQAALSILPTTVHGLNLNPRFGSIDGFAQTDSHKSAVAGELSLFARAGVNLLHGWTADPQQEEIWQILVEDCGDYDTAVLKMVEGEEISGIQAPEDAGDGDDDDEAKMLAAVEKRSQWTAEQERKVRKAHIIRQFLTSTQTQLSYHGLFTLTQQLAPCSLSALFRNSHLSVLYKRPLTPNSAGTTTQSGPQLFTLVTDSSFSHENEIVWESLCDVDGADSDFYDSSLRKSSTRGGDFVGRERRNQSEAESGLRNRFSQHSESRAAGNDDFALAQQLQHEEDEQARHDQREYEEYQRRLLAAETSPAVLQPGNLSVGPTVIAGQEPKRRLSQKKDKKKKDCTIM